MLLIEDRLLAARKHQSAGRTENAALIYEGILDISPANVEALKEMVSVRMAQGKLDEALNFAARAAGRAGDDCAALALLATTALLSGRHDTAAGAIEQGFARDPLHPEICMLKANALLLQGDRLAAERILIGSLTRHPDNVDVLCALSQMYMDGGLPEPALRYSRRALDLDGDNADLLAQVGTQLSLLGDCAAALPYLERAHLHEPGNIVVLSYLAETMLGLGQLTEAHRLARRAIGLRPDLLTSWQTYVKVMVYRGEADAALGELLAVARQHPEKTNALLTLAGCHRIAGNPGQSLRLLQPLMSKLQTLTAPQAAMARTLIRDCCLSLGLLEQVAGTFPPADAAAAARLTPRPENAGEMDPDRAVTPAETSIVVDSSLSSLDALVLLRFGISAPNAGAVTTVRGPSSLKDIVELMPGVRFQADDLPSDEDRAVVIEAVALASLLASPATLRGEMAAAAPYIVAPLERRAMWRRSLAGLPRPLVALAWDATRPGLLLDDLHAALAGFGGTLVSVMWDEARHQLAGWPAVIDAGVHFTSLADLAAVIAETDAIVGPNGVPLHMAGAMGARGALLTLPNWPWAWYHRGGQSAWYPSITVLPTRTLDHWSECIEQLAPAIADFCQSLTAGNDAAATPTPQGGN